MTKEEIKQLLKDYMWMMNEIIREREELNHIVGGNLVSKITDMPKAAGGTTSDPVANEAIRRIDKSKRIEKLEDKVLFIQKNSKCIKDDREITVLNLMLDGMSMQAICKHMKLSRTNVHNIRESLIEQIENFAHNKHK